MNVGRVCTTLAAGMLLLACGSATREGEPRGQIKLYVTTDAPLPLGPGELASATRPPPLFDRLRIDVFRPGADEPCSDCSRDFELDRVRVESGEASIGIVPAPFATGYVARARLFRFVTLEEGEPQPLSTIDTYAAIPAVAEDGIVNATITLRVDDLGKTRGSLADPIPATPGKPERVEEWPRAQRSGCVGEAMPGEVCVPGGAFWMGHPHAGLHAIGAEANVSRLITLSPFYVDAHEVTVAELRASGLAISTDERQDPLPGTAEDPAGNPFDPQYLCTYSEEPLAGAASRESLPVTCVSWSAASAYCGAQGKRLPSEAQYEYLASALRSELFVWGSADVGCVGSDRCDACADTVWGRGGFDQTIYGANWQCRASGDYGGPLPPGSGRLDRLTLDGGEVVDLMGNVAEWTRDSWNRISEGCWAGRTLLEDPSCETPSAVDMSEEGDLHTVKGQSWGGRPYPAANRRASAVGSSYLGFRCVRGN
jgi:formylglycine-generating enzyme required for sulfatase activity